MDEVATRIDSELKHAARQTLETRVLAYQFDSDAYVTCAAQV